MRPALAALAFVLLAPAVASALPDDDGPFDAASEVDTIQAGPAQVQVTVCLSNATGSQPIVALATNATEGREVLSGWCLHLATYGFVVIVPDLGYSNTDASSIGSTLLDSLAFLDREGRRDGSRFFGRIDSTHRAVLGFNTGATGALWAAANDDALSAAILLDPQDITGQARNVAPAVNHVPVLTVTADPNACNGNDSANAIYAALAGPRATLHVVQSDDCDAEWPAGNACQGACGIAHSYAEKLFRRFATAYAAYFVGCSGSMRTYLDGPAVSEAVTDRIVDHVDAQELPKRCGPYVELDAGAPDAGAATSGCVSAEATPVGPLAVLACVLALGLAARRR